MAANERGIRKHQDTSRGISSIDFNSVESIVGWVENRYENRDGHRFAMERQWFLNIAQYLGYQYHVFDNWTRTLVQDRAPPHRVRLVCNRLMMQVRKAVSKFVRQRPDWNVIPATTDQDDQVKALIGNRVLKAYWRSLGMDWKVVDLAFWIFTCGNAFMRVVWDPSKGEPLDLAGDMGDYQPQTKADEKLISLGLRTGDLGIDVVNPFELDPDPMALSLDQASHVLHSKLVSIDDLKARYGSKADGLEPEDQGNDGLSTYFTKKLKTLVGPTSLFSGSEEAPSDAVLTHTLWVNPTQKYPNGYFCVVAGGQLLHAAKELPNPFKRIPFVHFIETMVPGRFWATSMLEQTIGLQADYNRARSQVCESRNLMSKPKWLNPKGSGITQNSIDSEPGEVLTFNPGSKPEAWNPPPLPEYVIRSLEMTLSDMEDIAGVHEVTQGRAPSNARSGIAIAQLQEQDDQLLGPTFMLAEKSLGQIGSWALEILAKNVTEPRILKIVGKESGYDAFEFLGQDLIGQNAGRSGVSYFDVEVHMGSQLPQSPGARKQLVLDLVDRRILDPMQDRKKISQLLELGTEEPFLNDAQLDRQNARRENAIMRSEVMVEINPWDDDEVHIESHDRDRKQPDYLQVTSPQARLIHDMHIEQHKARLMARLAPPQMPPPQGEAQPAPEGMIPA